MQEGEIGTEGLKRILVQWEYGSGEQTQKPREFLFAEFDVESGELKLLTFWDRTICDALRQALSRPRPK